MNDDPVSLWIDDLKNEDNAAAQKLWNHFVSRLCNLARKKLRPATRRVYDEEDAALSAFRSVCIGVSAGRFPELKDRDGLWRLMLVITARKVMRQHKHDGRLRRNANHTSVREYAHDGASANGFDTIQSGEPSPEFAAEFFETCERLFASLDDQQLKDVVSLRLERYTDVEVGKQLNCSRRTVQRRLEIIRRHWGRLES